ncbi:hypothetical protein [Psychromonas sp. SP041]|uniref:hypothetical protein n=1 Tax=Psychromonas sp. SP041 TaxID=1365007 RepID=UPI0010C782E4|nr:hypothetical protein [Psychromonas sp. SP041]
MKHKNLLWHAVATASVLTMSSAAFATDTTLGITYGSVAIGETESYNAVEAQDAIVFDLKHEMSDNFYIEGRYAEAELKVGTELSDTETVTVSDTDIVQWSGGIGGNFDLGLTVISDVYVGGGYFKDSFEANSGDTDADGFYGKAGLNIDTGVTGLTLTGEYSYYVGEWSDTEVAYEYGLATAKLEYEVTSSLILNGAFDFADSESAYRIGGTYKF